jgi:aspartyl-tRNA(Asn)/glutamyl-tRNA(Gln) amidotransferase subunit B
MTDSQKNEQKVEYEAVMGLEVHVELSTKTKLFCGCKNVFGQEPNTNICPVCLGLPGSLPVLNEQAVKYAHSVSKALGFSVPDVCLFHRKNYFYPDMPKDFQTSQYDTPICFDGKLEVSVDNGNGEVNIVTIEIERAHLEEDTGKSTHLGSDGRIHNALASLIDYNRAGVPLLEIVTYPCIRSSEEARAYVSELRSILKSIGVSDVKMEEGSMRVDANISVRPKGQAELGTKTEIKNMNSIRSLGRAIDYEIERQIELVSGGGEVVQQTRHWSEVDNKTHPMRSKEAANDYRFFPEPDLMPVISTEEMLKTAEVNLPMLPKEKRLVLTSGGVSNQDAQIIVENEELYAFAEACIKSGTKAGKDVGTLCVTVILSYLNEGNELTLKPQSLVDVLNLQDQGKLSKNQTKSVIEDALKSRKDPLDIIKSKGLEQNSDEDALQEIVKTVINQNSKDWEQFVLAKSDNDEGKAKKLQGFFMGKCMAASRGKGNPGLFVQLINKQLSDK